jgi:hypothetical protein
MIVYALSTRKVDKGSAGAGVVAGGWRGLGGVSQSKDCSD